MLNSIMLTLWVRRLKKFHLNEAAVGLHPPAAPSGWRIGFVEVRRGSWALDSLCGTRGRCLVAAGVWWFISLCV